MATASEYESQMQGLAKQMESYTPTNIGDVTSDLMGRVDHFRPQYEEQRGMQAQAYATLPEFMSQYHQRYGGGGGAGPSAFGMLSSGMQDVGRQMGTADVLGDVIGRAGGKIENIAQSALGQYQAAQQALQNRYNMISPLFGAATAREEAARNRAAARRGSSGGSGGGGIVMPGGPGGDGKTLRDALSGVARRGITRQDRLSMTNQILGQYGVSQPTHEMYRLSGFSYKHNPMSSSNPAVTGAHALLGR